MAEKTDLDLYDSDEDTSEDDDTGDESTPSPRFWHFSQLVGDNVYIGGGNVPQFKKKKGRAHLLKTIEQFSVKERKWRQLETKGDHHPGLTSVACASFGKYLFAYGGNNSERLNGVLSQLDLDTFTWSQLSPETEDGPMRKDASGMVHFGEDSLAVMCGYATPKDSTKPNGGSSDYDSRFTARRGPSADGGGWTNEMHIFNYNFKDSDHLGMWTSFSFTGPRPPPCADFSLTRVDLYRAVLYGGRRGTDENSNDLYLIDFSEKVITKIVPENKEDKWPKMRLGHHAACCLGFNTENPHLLISGGRLKQKLPPKDIWIFNLVTKKWKQVELQIADDDIQRQLARWGHTFTAITHSEGLIEVIMFGGSQGYYEVTWDVYKRKDFGRLSFPASFILGFLGKEWEVLDLVQCDKDWTSKTTQPMPFDLESHITLDVLYSMERDKIPVLSELIRNEDMRSTICPGSIKDGFKYKWPTITKPSKRRPTWKKLSEILDVVDRNDLAKKMKHYLKEKGVEVCGKTKIEITPSSTKTLEWKEYGLKLYPQKNCLPPGVDKVTITILASIAGQYVFPEDLHLVSSVFWLHCRPNCVFNKPIKIQMEHCANTDDLMKLMFVRASTSSLPYTFKQLDGGLFFSQDHKDYGTIELSQFCGVTVCQQGSSERKYYAILFYLGPEIIPDKVHIALTWNVDGHITKVKNEYIVEKHAREGASQEIRFESKSDSITLDIPMPDGKNINGWKFIPLIYPEITKLQMDEFEIGQGTPCFQLQILVSDPFIRRKGLIHLLVLQGAKHPWNAFSVIIPAEVPIRRRLWTAGNVEDAGRPRKMLHEQPKSRSTSDADGFIFEGAASMQLDTDLEEDVDCIDHEPPQQAHNRQSVITNVMQMCKSYSVKMILAFMSVTILVVCIKLGDKYHHGSSFIIDVYPEFPTLPLLQNLNGLRILQEIGADYRKFGIAILNDQKGTIIETIEHDCNYKSDCINNKIATRWLNGHKNFQDTTWLALISVLCQIEKRNLAVQIRNKLQISHSYSC